jgi:hypothetical protein
MIPENEKVEFQLPILIIAYKRPHFLKKIFSIIERLNINIKLYIFIDGFINEIDKVKVIECIKISNNVINKNKIIYNSKNNLGCAFGPIYAINWLFENEEMGIILEDDCIPELSFFNFCFELLIKYFTDKRIYHISGSQFDILDNKTFSYVYSKESHNWGWATWRRAWQQYEYFTIPEDVSETIWDYQWQKTIQKNNGVTILPRVNLVKNLGYGIDATHTTNIEDCQIRETQEINFPLIHPTLIYSELYVTKCFE